jgi:threonine aldolase
VQTNIVRFELTGLTAPEFLAACRRHGVLGGGGGRRIRFVTHYGIGAEDVQRALSACSTVLAA